MKQPRRANAFASHPRVPSRADRKPWPPSRKTWDNRRAIFNAKWPGKARAMTAPTPPQSDELWMDEAIRCAQRALEIGEVPVGAVVVCSGDVVGRGWNR